MSYYSRLATAIAEHEYCDRRETPPRRSLVQRMRDLELQIELLLGHSDRIISLIRKK